MSKTAHGLGKGLGALIDTTVTKKKTEGQVEELAIDSIQVNEHQPRTAFDEAALQELSASVREYGVLQPVLVRRLGNGYGLIAGERRFRAAKLAGLKKIPAIIRDYDEVQVTEVALIENLQRQDLNAVEEAKALLKAISRLNIHNFSGINYGQWCGLSDPENKARRFEQAA